MGLLALGLSLVLLLIHARMQASLASGRINPAQVATNYPLARSAITGLCLASIKSLGALFAILLAGGSISSEIERGLLAVILPKPIPRWQILLGKWIGLNVILVGSVLVWTTLVWASLSWQTHENLTAILHAGLYLSLFPVVISTLSLTLSTFAQRVFGTSLTMAIVAFAWCDGIFNVLANSFDVDALRLLANIASLVVPQGTIGWWVDGVTQDITIQNPAGPGRGAFGLSPRLLTEWGAAHLHFPRLDALYVAAYIVVIFLFGAIVFHQRDV